MGRTGTAGPGLALQGTAGQVEYLAGDADTAEVASRACWSHFGEVGDTANYVMESWPLAKLAYELGRLDEVARLAEMIEQNSPPYWAWAQVTWRAMRSKLLARQGRFDEAQGLAREATRLVEATDFLNLHGDVLMDLAEVLRLAGRADEAARAAEGALRKYEQKDNVVMAGRAGKLSKELSK